MISEVILYHLTLHIKMTMEITIWDVAYILIIHIIQLILLLLIFNMSSHDETKKSIKN